MLESLTPAGRTGQPLVHWGAAALLLVALPCLLLGCPGELEDPDRFSTDAGAGGGSSTSSSTSSGTGGSTSSSSSSTTSGTAGGGGSSSGAGGG